jgi:ribosomal protein S18 acetylase RimI-like enzyme
MADPARSLLPLDTPGAVDAPIRRLSSVELPECVRLAQDRGWPRELNKWRLLFEISDVYGVDAPDGGLAGIVVSTSYGDVTSAIGMMLVAERFERRGLGRRLMRHAMEHSGTAGALLTATKYGIGLYERLGFRVIGECGTYVGEPTTRPLAGRPLTRPATVADLPALHALDAEVVGAPRTELLSRLPSFCRQLRVVSGPEGIIGYGGAWQNDSDTVIGPVIARDPDTALALISELADAAGGPVRVNVDHRHSRIVAWAKEAGPPLHPHGVGPRLTTASGGPAFLDDHDHDHDHDRGTRRWPRGGDPWASGEADPGTPRAAASGRGSRSRCRRRPCR